MDAVTSLGDGVALTYKQCEPYHISGMNGAFFVFEGIDGSGKTTLCENLGKALAREGRKVHVTQEPTHDEIGSFIRNGTVKGISQKAEALLFVADRAIHTDRIRKLVEEGYIVLCDRYFASTVAYQSAPLNGDCLDRKWLIEIHKPVTMTPDMTFLMDIDADAGMNRVTERGARSKFEDAEYQRRVREVYLELAEEFGFKVINAQHTQDEILAEVLEIVRRVI